MATDLKHRELHAEIECDNFSLSKWSPLATEINREEFLSISFSHHMEILHKTKNINEVLYCIHETVVHQWDKYNESHLHELKQPRIFYVLREFFYYVPFACHQHEPVLLRKNYS